MSVTDDNDKVDIDDNINDNGSKNDNEPEIEPGGHTKPSSNKTLGSCHLGRKGGFDFDKMVDRCDKYVGC